MTLGYLEETKTCQILTLPAKGWWQNMIRKPRERSKPGKRSNMSKALPPCWGLCIQLSHYKLQMAFVHIMLT
jgi:hypothetical protein